MSLLPPLNLNYLSIPLSSVLDYFSPQNDILTLIKYFSSTQSATEYGGFITQLGQRFKISASVVETKYDSLPLFVFCRICLF
jgi:hypothetical protein